MASSVSPARYKVFLSHSGPDTWVARQLCLEMEKRGAQIFLDEASVHVGTRFEEDILSALNEAHELVVLMTPWGLNRPYVWAELGAAWGRRIPIVAILHGMAAAELQARPGIPIFIKERDLVDLNGVDKYLQQLLARVTSHSQGAPGHA
jgi:TIR domain